MTGAPAGDRLVARTSHRLTPDPSRTLSRLFVPGQERLIRGGSRAKAVVDRILALTDEEVDRTLATTVERFGARHRDLEETLERHFGLIVRRLGQEVAAGRARRLLIGAYFTQEYALEAAAVFNPSMVPHPDQSGCAPGEVRFVMSLRAVGEGHLSCVEFRSGTAHETGEVRLDPPGRFLDVGRLLSVAYDRELFRAKFADLGHEDEEARSFWDLLPGRFSAAELDAAIKEYSRRRRDSVALVDAVRWMAASTYAVEFDEHQDLSERVLWPHGPAESHGMEDARFVRVADGEGGRPVYYGTYSAFDGSQVAPQMVRTADFLTFTVSQLSGPSIKNKGMALFPRRVGGRYAALSRWDRERNSIAYSDDARRWGASTVLQTPSRPWELIQLGNCGSPIETPAGWLVLTHGVGPMREYAIGAMLLDRDEPERVLAQLPEPLLAADDSERDGYVPNVVYSCGAMLAGNALVLPYGCGDSSVRVATVELDGLLNRLLPG